VSTPPRAVELHIDSLVVERRPTDSAETVGAAIDRAVAHELRRRDVTLPPSVRPGALAAAIVATFDDRNRP
jgi:hypothetical protein